MRQHQDKGHHPPYVVATPSEANHALADRNLRRLAGLLVRIANPTQPPVQADLGRSLGLSPSGSRVRAGSACPQGGGWDRATMLHRGIEHLAVLWVRVRVRVMKRAKPVDW